MSEEEYIKYVESDEDLLRIIEVNSNICAIIDILINKGICKPEEFKKIKQENKKEILNNSYKREKQEDLKAVKTINDFINLFGDKE